MILLACPNCGRRNVQEFRFGGAYQPRPSQPEEVSEQVWVDYLYMRDNTWGVQREWWYHRAGCGLWFLAERHTRTNEVVATYKWRAPEQRDDETVSD